MMAEIPRALQLRSYTAEFHPHTHSHVQIVLPVAGTMDIDIEQRGQRLDVCLGAVVPPTLRHGQFAEGANRFLIINAVDDQFAERFAASPYFSIGPALRRLIDFIDLSAHDERWLQANASLCMPLLLDAIGEGNPPPVSRLDGLRQQMERSIDRRWQVADMARVAGVSASRLHSLFRTALGQSPNRYLAALRLSHALRILSSTDTPICAVAQEAGYADQSALTRAMRNGLGITPAKFRRTRQ